MKVIRFISLPVLLIGLLLATPMEQALAQITDTTGTALGWRGAPRSYKMDTRTIAMGDATVADPTRSTAININPAALAFVRDFKSVHMHSFQNWNNNLMMTNVTLPVMVLGQHRFAAQVAYHNTGFATFNHLGENPQPEPDLHMYQADLTYTYSYENVLSFGILNSISYGENEYAHYWTYFTNLGVLYAPSESISYGIAFRGLGRSLVYELIEDGRTTLGSQDLRESLEIGASLQYPIDTDYTYMSLSLSNEKRFGQDGLWYKAGLELKAFSIFALRSGILFQLAEEIYAPRFGMGLNTKFLSLDYAFSYRNNLYERYHQVGLILHF